jgi:hypothetical protein
VICQRARHSIDVGDDPMQHGFEFSQTERPAFGWSLLSEGLALQLLFLTISESMGNHDSKIVDADSVD